jgi:hypothetical protein
VRYEQHPTFQRKNHPIPAAQNSHFSDEISPKIAGSAPQVFVRFILLQCEQRSKPPTQCSRTKNHNTAKMVKLLEGMNSKLHDNLTR